PHMTGRTDRVLSMSLHPLAHGPWMPIRTFVIQRGHVRRRRWRRRAEHVVEDQPSTQHGGRANGQRLERQDTSMAQQAASRTSLGGHALKAASVEVWNSVVASQAVVDERVIRREELDKPAILPNLTQNEELRFLPEGVTQIVVEVGEDLQIGI